jgi:serine protease Do
MKKQTLLLVVLVLCLGMGCGSLTSFAAIAAGPPRVLKAPDQEESANESTNESASESNQESEESAEAPTPENDQQDESDSSDSERQPSQEKESSQSEDQSEKGDKTQSNDKSEQESDESKDKNDSTEDSQSESKGKESKERSSRSSSRRSFFGQSSKSEEKYSKRSKDFIAVFEPLVSSATASTVKIMNGRRQLALGTVVDSEGYVLTKASELKGKVSCKFSDGRQASAKVVGIDPTTDLALLKVDIDNVNVVQWKEGPAPLVGQWLATPNLKSSKLAVGIVGVDERTIPPSDPFIGITMDNLEGKDGVKILSVVARSPADDADLLINDVITHIDEIETKDIESLRKTLGQYDPNDQVTLSIIRASQEMKIKLTLGEKDKISPQNDRSNQQNSMGSTPSRRRKDFPNAFQHDSMLSAINCGGPVVDLDGQVVGINIARAGRVASLSLPVQTVLPVVAMLKTGEYAPELVNKAKIESIEAELAALAAKIKQLPEKQNKWENLYQVENAKQQELDRILKDVQDRLKVIELKSKSFKTELDSVKRELKNSEKVRQRLEADRKQLATGVR